MRERSSNLKEELQGRLAIDRNWSELRVNLLRQIVQENAFLLSIDSGWIRVQRREPGQIQWSDYTEVEAGRTSETIKILKDIVAKMDWEQRPDLTKELA